MITNKEGHKLLVLSVHLLGEHEEPLHLQLLITKIKAEPLSCQPGVDPIGTSMHFSF
jgi:hypothetical protein